MSDPKLQGDPKASLAAQIVKAVAIQSAALLGVSVSNQDVKRKPVGVRKLKRTRDTEQELKEARNLADIKKAQAEAGTVTDVRVIRVVVAWFILTVAIVALCFLGFTIAQVGFGYWKLSDTVLIAFMATTIVDVVGLVYYVAHYAFPSEKPPPRFRNVNE